MNKRKIKYQKLEISVTGANAEITKDADADKLMERITGIHVTTSDSNGIKNGTFTRFDIDGTEVFCPGYEAKLLSTGMEVSPNDKYYKLDEPAKGVPISIKYKDGNAAGTTFPYTVNITLRLENTNDTSTTGNL